MVRFDGYSATTQAAKATDLLALLVEAPGVGNVKLIQGKGFHTFGDRIGVKDGSGIEMGSVMWGGKQGDRTMIEVKGEYSPPVVEALRSRFPHRCTRADACADFDAPGAFERLLAVCTAVKGQHRLIGEKQGDWDDHPELGRTAYYGSRASVARVRLYEKGKQPEYRHLDRPNWARLEVQVRPAKEAKTAFSKLSPVEVWGASAWTRQIAGELLEEHIDPHPAGTTYRHTERDAALRWMCKQYGAHLVDLANDLGGWDVMGLTLREMLKEQTH
jgi:DNA relaxase NicK